MNGHPPADGTTAEATCSLGSGELTDRVAAWRQLASRALERTERPGHLTSVYPRDDDLVERLHQLIAAEGDCCSFLRFTVREDADVVRVDLEYPQQAEALATAVLGSD